MMRTSTKWLIGTITVLLLVDGAYLASPYFALWSLQHAVATGDAAALDDDVDFAAVRDGLKTQLAEQVESHPRVRDNPLASLGAALLPGLSGPVIDRLVTPRSVAALLKGGRPGGDTPARGLATYHSGYAGLNRFLLRVERRDAPDHPTVFRFDRRGLFGWKLVEIRLPDDALTPRAG